MEWVPVLQAFGFEWDTVCRRKLQRKFHWLLQKHWEIGVGRRMLLSLAELWAGPQGAPLGCGAPSNHGVLFLSPRVDLLSARGLGYQESTPLGVGNRDERHTEGCEAANVGVHESRSTSLPPGSANKGWLIRVKWSSCSTSPNEHFAATPEGSSWKHPFVSAIAFVF